MARLRADLITVLEVEAENHFAKNFELEAYVDATPQDWPDRKDQDKSRKLLVSSGDLKKAATSARRSGKGVVFVFNQVYARVHNDGLQAGRGSGFKMPRRRFIGPSVRLNERLDAKFKKVITQHLNTNL